MWLGILSDTHDNVARTTRAVRQLVDEGADALVHLGDFTSPDVIYACAGLPASFLWGNCDEDLDALRAAISAIGGTCLERGGEIERDGRRIAMTHGDQLREYQRLLATAPDYLLSGHSHALHDRREQSTRCVNPGALHRAPRFTVALLNPALDELRFLNIA